MKSRFYWWTITVWFAALARDCDMAMPGLDGVQPRLLQLAPKLF
jgi:hypothetical protein